MQQLLIIEPNLYGSGGHYAEFVRAIGSSVSGVPLAVFAHPDADSLLGTMPGVTVSRRLPRVGDPLAEWRTMYRSIAEGTRFLLLTADGRHAAAASLFSVMLRCRPDNASFFFHRAPTTWRDNLLHQFTFAARKCSLAVTSTEQVADTLRALGWQRVVCVPYPVIAPVALPAPGPFSHLLMAGAARLNKGLDLVADLAADWAVEGKSLPLFVQISRKHSSKHGVRESVYVEKLLSSGYRGLQVDADAPVRSVYIERFHGALVLAPYVREQFASQVSGVVLDALLHGAPVIATKGTWPATQVERFGAGITLVERNARSLAAAIEDILGSWESYSTRACEAARVLAREHDPGHLLKLLSQQL